MESLLLNTNYVSTKVSAISTQASEKYGQNGMREKGGRARWRRKKNGLGSVVGGRWAPL